MSTGIDNIYVLSGGNKLHQKYIIYPEDDRVHKADFSLREEVSIVLRREDVDDPLKAFLNNNYIVVRVENAGSPLPFFKAVYGVEIYMNRNLIVNDHKIIGSLIGFMRLLDEALRGSINWHCHIFNPDGDGHPVKVFHGEGARTLSITLRMNRSHGRF